MQTILYQPPGGSSKANESAKEQHRFSPKSSVNEAQRQRIIDALRTGPKTSYDMRRMVCYQAPASIIELRRMGYVIETELVTLTDRDGFMHPRCARYHLVSELAKVA